MANRWVLRVLRRGELVREQPLDQAITKVGSQAPADLILDDPSIARLHAVLQHEASGELEVIDLGAEGGVRVHGERVATARLRAGDRVALGEAGIELEVRLAEDGAAPAPSAPSPARPAPAAGRPWDACPGCGISLSPEDRERGRCAFCDGELPAAPPAPVPEPAAAPAPVTVSAPTPAEAPAQAAPLPPGQRARWALYLALGTAAFFSLVSSCLGSCVFERDPFFGQHAALYCPLVCKGCHGPYVYLSWSSSSSGGGKRASHLVPYCRTPDKPLERTGWSQLLSDRLANDRYAFPLGVFGLFLASIPLWLGVIVALVLLLLLLVKVRGKPRDASRSERPRRDRPPRRWLRRAGLYGLLALGPGFLVSYCASGRVQGATRVFFWNGRSPLRCKGREVIELRGRRIVTGDAAIQARERCRVTLVDTEIETGEQGIRLDGEARVTLRRSRVRAGRMGAWVGDRARLDLEGSRIESQKDHAVFVSGAGTVEGRDARLESPTTALRAGPGAAVRIHGGRLAGKTAVSTGEGARVRLDRVEVVGETSGPGDLVITAPEARSP